MFKAHLYKYKHITIYTYNKYAIIIDVKYYLLQYNIFNIIYKTSHIFEYILFIKHELFILMKKIVVLFNDIFFHRTVNFVKQTHFRPVYTPCL